MNERIQELAEQATEHDYTTWDSYNQKELVYYKFNQEKFAELIVRECAEVASNYDGVHYVGTAIKQHFGVEE